MEDVLVETYFDILVGFAAYRPAMWLARAIVEPIFDRYWPVRGNS